MNVNVRSIRPRMTVGQQDGEYGPRLFARNPDECCFLRKVEPLERALADYDAWATGLRRDESPTRANTPVVAFDPKRGKVKVNPIAAWTQADVDRYIARWNVPVNELFKKGYGSIGCWPCTRRTKAGEDPRAGRWAMFEKTECGLHVLSRRSDGVVLVAHGSRDPRAAAPPRRWRGRWPTAHPEWEVHASYLDHAGPRPLEVLRLAVAAGPPRARCWCRCC